MTALQLSPAQCASYAATRPVRGSRRAVLDSIARHVDWNGPNMGSVKMRLCVIAEEVKLCLRSVRRHIAELLQAGEIEREDNFRADESQTSTRWKIPGLIALSQIVTPPAQNMSGGEDSSVRASPMSESTSKIPPTPKTRSETTRRDRRQEGGEEAKALGVEALKAYGEQRAEAWETLEATAKTPEWLGDRIRRLGGLEAWRELLSRAKSSNWLRSMPFGPTFFLAPVNVQKIRAGGFGVRPPPRAPEQISAEALAARPWLALMKAPDLPYRLAALPSHARAAGLDEADRRRIFGRARELFALWKYEQEAAE